MQARAEQQRSPVLRPREPFGALDLSELGGAEPSETFQRSLAQARAGRRRNIFVLCRNIRLQDLGCGVCTIFTIAYSLTIHTSRECFRNSKPKFEYRPTALPRSARVRHLRSNVWTEMPPP